MPQQETNPKGNEEDYTPPKQAKGVSYASIVLTTIITRSRNGDDSLCRLLDWPHRLTRR